MFQKLSLLFFFTIVSNSFAQNATVEKSVTGIQTGLAGLWVYNEMRLSEQFSLRGELGLEVGVITTGPSDDKKFNYVGAPVVSLEPRWYYNLNKREAKGYNTKKNSGNLFSLKVNYLPDTFLITNNENLNVVNQLAFIPKWGIRRVYGNHFTFETGFGVGPQISWGKDSKNITDKEDVYIDLTLRIGYTL